MGNLLIKFIIYLFLFSNFLYSQDTIFTCNYLSEDIKIKQITKIDTIDLSKKLVKEKRWNEKSEFFSLVRNPVDTIEGFILSSNYKKNKIFQSGIGLKNEYYDNGSIKRERKLYDSKNGWNNTFYYPNGKKMFYLKEFYPTIRNSKRILLINQFWDKNGKQQIKDGEGQINAEFNKGDVMPIFINFDSLKITGNFKVEGTIIRGRKEGIWKITDIDNKLVYSENYNDNNFVDGKLFNQQTEVESRYNSFDYLTFNQSKAIEAIFLKELKRRIPFSDWAKKGKKESGYIKIFFNINEKGEIKPMYYESNSKHFFKELNKMLSDMIKFKSVPFKIDPVNYRGKPRSFTYELLFIFNSPTNYSKQFHY